MKKQIIALILLVTAAYILRAEEDIEFRRITYKEFVSAVEAGEIEKVRIYNLTSMESTMHTQEGDVRFDTHKGMTVNEDPLLQRLLEKHDVELEITETRAYEPPGIHFDVSTLILFIFLFGLAGLILSLVQLSLLKRLTSKG